MSCWMSLEICVIQPDCSLIDGKFLYIFFSNFRDSPVQYDYVISERLGRTTIKEQYAFVYRYMYLTFDFGLYD